jgi:hypothetical protein
LSEVKENAVPHPGAESAQEEAAQAPGVVAKVIADQLGETEAGPRRLILRLVKHLGVDAALAFLKQTLEIEEQGGMMLPDGSRRRTPGGVWLFLVRKSLPAQDVARLFPHYRLRLSKEGTEGTDTKTDAATSSPKPAPTTPTTFRWAERHAVLTEIGTERGAARTVKMTVIGRPGNVIERGQCVITTMVGSAKAPALPKGVPTPPEIETTYTLYIGAKQWKKVAQAIDDPEDLLIVEGYPQLDLKTQSVAVFVTSTTTKNLQRAQREALQAPKG